jgi:hypothetical protein
MRLGSKLRARAFATSAFLIVLGCVSASAPLSAKQYPLPKGPQRVRPPKVHLIRCAEALVPHGGWPCWPDPGMLRLNPHPDAPDLVPPSDKPQFFPSR